MSPVHCACAALGASMTHANCHVGTRRAGGRPSLRSHPSACAWRSTLPQYNHHNPTRQCARPADPPFGECGHAVKAHAVSSLRSRCAFFLRAFASRRKTCPLALASDAHACGPLLEANRPVRGRFLCTSGSTKNIGGCAGALCECFGLSAVDSWQTPCYTTFTNLVNY